MNNYDIVAAAAEQVRLQLHLLESEWEEQRYRMDVRSRTMCRCTNCRTENKESLVWVASMRGYEKQTRPAQ